MYDVTHVITLILVLSTEQHRTEEQVGECHRGNRGNNRLMLLRSVEVGGEGIELVTLHRGCRQVMQRPLLEIIIAFRNDSTPTT